MSRARCSLSPTASSHPVEESKPDRTLSGIIAETSQNAPSDLEDGEITDDNVEGTDAVDGTGEVVVKPVPSSDHDGRLDEERLSEPLGREPKGRGIPGTGQNLNCGAESSSHQLPISSIPVSNLTRDVPDANLSCALSEEEIEMAKDVVLDLLGWGVQPEYLIECGISSHAIHRIFTDLHLRLPSNLAYLGPR